MTIGRELDTPLLDDTNNNNTNNNTNTNSINNMGEPNPNTVADGYSRTDQRIPIATSTTPVAPPLDFDYNDGVPDPGDYGATGEEEDSYDNESKDSSHQAGRRSSAANERASIITYPIPIIRTWNKRTRVNIDTITEI